MEHDFALALSSHATHVRPASLGISALQLRQNFSLPINWPTRALVHPMAAPICCCVLPDRRISTNGASFSSVHFLFPWILIARFLFV